MENNDNFKELMKNNDSSKELIDEYLQLSVFSILSTRQMEILKKIIVVDNSKLYHRDDFNNTPLMYLISQNEYSFCEWLLEHLSQIFNFEKFQEYLHCFNYDFRTALGIAVEKNNYDMCILLLKYISNINYSQRLSPLYFAVEKSNVKICQLLLDNKINVHSKIFTEYNCTALMIAINNNNFEICKLLIPYYDHINDVDSFGATTIFYIFDNEVENLNMFMLLYENFYDTIDFNYKYKYRKESYTILHLSCKFGYYNILKYMLN